MGFLDDLPGVESRRNRSGQRRAEKVPLPPPVEPEFDGLETVYWQVIRCPHCHSEKVPVYATKRPIRYHKCLECKQLFKSIEQ